MEYRIHGFRHGDYLAQTVEEYRPLWHEVAESIESVAEADVVAYFEANDLGKRKSISHAVNCLLKEQFVARGWHAESQIFSEREYSDGGSIFRIDFAKGSISSHPSPWNAGSTSREPRRSRARRRTASSTSIPRAPLPSPTIWTSLRARFSHPRAVLALPA